MVSKSSDHHFELVNGLVRTKFDEKNIFGELSAATVKFAITLY